MKSVVKILMVVLIVVLSFGFFLTPKSYAEYPPDYKVEKVYSDGHVIKIVYDAQGGIVEITIDSND